MNILISGGAGYIGSVTANLFIDKGHNVTIIDNLITGDKRNIPKKAKFVKSNFSNKKNISDLLKKNKFDILLHFAAYIDVEESVKYPKKYIKNNYLNATKFFEICSKYGLNNFILSSTAAVYGNSDKAFCSEKTLLKPQSPYAYSKLKCEDFLKKRSKFKYVILRYFNVAGADLKLRNGLISKNKSTHLIKKICENYLKNKPITIYGTNYPTKDGTAERDYIHVADLAYAHYQSSLYLLKKKKSVILNCGYGKSFSVLEIVKKFNLINKNKIKFNFGNRRKGDVIKLVASSSKIKKVLKWKPRHNSINKILISSLNWEKKLCKLI